MNDNIKELAEQAGVWQPDHNHKTWIRGEYIASPGELAKFAELIVKKCAEISRSHQDFPESEQTIRLWVAEDIERHFGVKE